VDDTVFGNRTAAFNDLKIKSNDDIQLFIEGIHSGALGYFQIYGSSYTDTPIEVFRVEENGDMWADGTKSAKVEAGVFGERLLYAVESPEVWFEDFGSGLLVNGVAIVEIDPLFAETVNLGDDYHVFLTPVGGWAELYVTARNAGSFEVRDARGTAGVEFSYRLVAKRRGYEDVRMEAVVMNEE